MKIGSVPYLNARPLVDWLERNPREDFTLSYATPSVLIRQLFDGSLDIAMASTFPTLEHPELRLLPGLGVTTTGAAWSVRLLSAVPVAEIRTVALDASSRSTVAMARIVLADRYGLAPDYIDHAPDLAGMLAAADAAVLIGDIGITAGGESLIDLDLGNEWHALTGLPFYFAGWVARDEAVLEQAAPLFFEALEHGLARLPQIAAEEAVRLETSEGRCYDYLAKIMRYHAGEAEVAGLEEFRRRAERLGLITPARPGLQKAGLL
ncbi:MAG: menaquinone biosynthetic enzyme MqnA/MqnD family protein [Armatimonadota bacterium]